MHQKFPIGTGTGARTGFGTFYKRIESRTFERSSVRKRDFDRPSKCQGGHRDAQQEATFETVARELHWTAIQACGGVRRASGVVAAIHSRHAHVGIGDVQVRKRSKKQQHVRRRAFQRRPIGSTTKFHSLEISEHVSSQEVPEHSFSKSC